MQLGRDVANYSELSVGLDLHPRMNTEETMGGRIARQMEVKNLTQAELARVLNVTRVTVHQWVHDLSEPTPENLTKIAAVLFDGDVMYLVHGPDREPPGGFPSVSTGQTGRFKSPFKSRG